MAPIRRTGSIPDDKLIKRNTSNLLTSPSQLEFIKLALDSTVKPTRSNSNTSAVNGQVRSVRSNGSASQSASHKKSTHTSNSHKSNNKSQPTTPRSGDKRTSTKDQQENVRADSNNVQLGQERRKSAKKMLNLDEDVSTSTELTTGLSNVTKNLSVTDTATATHSALTNKALSALLHAVESIYQHDDTTLTQLHNKLKPLLPLTPLKYHAVHTICQQLCGNRLTQRLEQQLLALNADGCGAVNLKYLPTYEKTGLQLRCSSKKCVGITASYLQSMCTQCGSVGSVEVVDQHYFMSTTAKKPKSSKKDANDESADAESSSTSVILPNGKHELSDPAIMLQRREESTLRAIANIRKQATRGKLKEFSMYGGDIIFLLRNAIYRGKGPVGAAAKEAVEAMLKRWDKEDTSMLDSYCEVEQLMGFAECLHAKREMQWHADKEIDRITTKIRTALSHVSVTDLLRYDPVTATKIPLTEAGYCLKCGKFEKLSLGTCQQANCTETLTREREFEAMTESLVWTSVFADIGITPLHTHDSAVTMPAVLKFMKDIRPYQSIATLGKDSYITQGYWITHLLFIMSGWGACQLEATLFAEELLFLHSNMDVVIKIKDPELVGEYLHSLHILGVKASHVTMQKGLYYLLTTEKSAKEGLIGNWQPGSATYHQKYHTAYTSVIGLADMQFDKAGNEKQYMPDEWRHFFE